MIDWEKDLYHVHVYDIVNDVLSKEESLLREYYRSLKNLIDYDLISSILNELLSKKTIQNSIMIFFPNLETISQCFKVLKNQLLTKNNE